MPFYIDAVSQPGITRMSIQRTEARRVTSLSPFSPVSYGSHVQQLEQNSFDCRIAIIVPSFRSLSFYSLVDQRTSLSLVWTVCSVLYFGIYPRFLVLPSPRFFLSCSFSLRQFVDIFYPVPFNEKHASQRVTAAIIAIRVPRAVDGLSEQIRSDVRIDKFGRGSARLGSARLGRQKTIGLSARQNIRTSGRVFVRIYVTNFRTRSTLPAERNGVLSSFDLVDLRFPSLSVGNFQTGSHSSIVCSFPFFHFFFSLFCRFLGIVKNALRAIEANEQVHASSMLCSQLNGRTRDNEASNRGLLLRSIFGFLWKNDYRSIIRSSLKKKKSNFIGTYRIETNLILR